MVITIKLFAHYRELLGKPELTIPARAGLTVAEVYDETIGDRVNSELRKSTMFAVNESYVPADTKVSDGDRIAFIPPVSGG
jgi:molybdopterin synthase sulfur carrier subunit